MVRNKPAQIRGTIRRSNDTSDDITVVLVPAPALRRNPFLYRTARPDPSGAFELKNLAPGEYSLLALEGVLVGAWLDPEFLAAYEERGLRVLLQRGEVSVANVEVVPSTRP